MRTPSIFAWPTPWLWLAIAVLVAVHAGHFSDLLAGLAGVVIAASVVHLLVGGVRSRRRATEDSAPAGPPGLDDRLRDIERRLTDTQDVMIALSEKMDRWEREGAGPGVTTDPRTTEPT